MHDPCVVDVSRVPCILSLRFPFLPAFDSKSRKFPDPMEGWKTIHALIFPMDEMAAPGATAVTFLRCGEGPLTTHCCRSSTWPWDNVALG
jgi:hypothetical protein